MNIQAEAEVLLEEKKSKISNLSIKTILKRLIHCVRPEEPITTSKKSFKNDSVLFEKDEKPLIIAREDQEGHFSLALDSGVRACDPDQIATLCLKAIREYCFRDEDVL